MICRGSSPTVGSSRISTGGSLRQRLRQAYPLPIAFGEIADEAPLHLLDAAQFHHFTDFAGPLTAAMPLTSATKCR